MNTYISRANFDLRPIISKSARISRVAVNFSQFLRRLLDVRAIWVSQYSAYK